MYISDLPQPYVTSRSLKFPVCPAGNKGDLAFEAVALTLWNGLPTLRSAPSVDDFKKQLEAH